MSLQSLIQLCKVILCEDFMWHKTCVLKINHNTSKTHSKNIKEMVNLTSDTNFSLTPRAQLAKYFLPSHKDFRFHPFCRFLSLSNGNPFLPQKQMY